MGLNSPPARYLSIAPWEGAATRLALLEQIESCTVVGIDRDKEVSLCPNWWNNVFTSHFYAATLRARKALEHVAGKLGEYEQRVHLVHDSYVNLQSVLADGGKTDGQMYPCRP